MFSILAQDNNNFQLEALDQAAFLQHDNNKIVRQKRKRRLIVDEQKNIGGDEMKANMLHFRDTIQPLDLAPPTKILMRIKESNMAERLFSMPGCTMAIQDPQLIRVRFYVFVLEIF